MDKFVVQEVGNKAYGDKTRAITYQINAKQGKKIKFEDVVKLEKVISQKHKGKQLGIWVLADRWRMVKNFNKPIISELDEYENYLTSTSQENLDVSKFKSFYQIKITILG